MDSPVIRAVKAVFYVGPLLFGLGFLAPLIAQSLVAFGVEAPFGLRPITVGLVAGLGLGLLAQFRGRWI